MKRQSVQVLDKEQIIACLRAHKLYLEKEFGVTKIALFGSYARNEQRLDSDVDVLVEMKIHDFKKRFYLKEFLEKQLSKRVDVGYLCSVRLFVRRYIEKDLIYA